MIRIRTSILSLLIAGFGFLSVANADIHKTVYYAQNPNITKAMNSLTEGNLENAQKYLKKASRADLAKSQKSMVYNNLCAVEYNLGEMESALKSCNKAVRADRKDYKAYINRANAYVALYQHNLAEEDYKMALNLEPRSKAAHEAYEIFKTLK